MPHDVFISHSSKDKVVADMVVARLEAAGIRCWVAPRDIMPGASWAGSIVEGINGCRAMVVVFSMHANQSHHVSREVERAVARGAVVMPLRIEDVMPAAELEYFLSSAHWMDAITPPMEAHLDRLANRLAAVLSADAKPRAVDELTPQVQSDVATPKRQRSAASPRRWIAATAATIAVLGTLAAIVFWQRPTKNEISAVYADYRREHDSDGMRKIIIDRAPTQFAVWRKAADAGDHDAQFLVGRAFSYGVVVPQNPREAFGWWTKAAEAGHVGAMAQVGYCYSTGEGIAADQGLGMFWFRKAADGGDAVSQFAIGALYAKGVGVQQDKAEAVRWIRKAADGGLDIAIVTLGGAYASGEGVPRDDEEAVRQFHKAADHGFKLGMRRLGTMYLEGRGVERDPAQALGWYTKAASEPGADADAMYAIGVVYENGHGVTKNPAVAAGWYRKGAEAGSDASMVEFGRACLSGQVVTQDFPGAAKWFGKAAALGNTEAMTELGLMARHGSGYPVDLNLAHQWFQKAAESGDINGMVYVAQDFATGAGVKRASNDEARQWFAKAADRAKAADNGQRLYLIAMAYLHEYPEEIDRVRPWMSAAASAQNQNAAEWLKRNPPSRS